MRDTYDPHRIEKQRSSPSALERSMQEWVEMLSQPDVPNQKRELAVLMLAEIRSLAQGNIGFPAHWRESQEYIRVRDKIDGILGSSLSKTEQTIREWIAIMKDPGHLQHASAKGALLHIQGELRDRLPDARLNPPILKKTEEIIQLVEDAITE